MCPAHVCRRGDDHGVRLQDRPKHFREIVLVGASPGQAPIARLAGTYILLDESCHGEFRRTRHGRGNFLHHNSQFPIFRGEAMIPNKLVILSLRRMHRMNVLRNAAHAAFRDEDLILLSGEILTFISSSDGSSPRP